MSGLPRSAAIVAITASSIGLGTWLFGWVAVPVVAAVAGAALASWRGVPALTAAGATLAWACLTLFAAADGRAAILARQLGEILMVHWTVVVLVTLLFPAALAWSAARVAQGVVLTVTPRREDTRVAPGGG